MIKPHNNKIQEALVESEYLIYSLAEILTKKILDLYRNQEFLSEDDIYKIYRDLSNNFREELRKIFFSNSYKHLNHVQQMESCITECTEQIINRLQNLSNKLIDDQHYLKIINSKTLLDSLNEKVIRPIVKEHLYELNGFKISEPVNFSKHQETIKDLEKKKKDLQNQLKKSQKIYRLALLTRSIEKKEKDLTEQIQSEKVRCYKQGITDLEKKINSAQENLRQLELSISNQNSQIISLEQDNEGKGCATGIGCFVFVIIAIIIIKAIG